MATIILPSGHPSKEGVAVLAGVEFVDGRATVPDIGPNARAYFEGVGAKVREPRPKPDGEG